jgi:archaellum component FlaC
MLDMMELWTGGLTIFMALIGYIMHEKFNELGRISILLNKTREEIARDNVTQAEIDKVMEHIDSRFNKLENKIDQLIQR